MELIRCEKCKFWIQYDFDINKGECRKLPPLMDHRGYATWPMSNKDNGCFAGSTIKGLLTEAEIAVMDAGDRL